MFLMLLGLVFQEYYYVDGMTFTMKDGTVFKTIADVKEDHYNYRFIEGTEEIVLSREWVRSVDYFSFRLLGRRPARPYKNIHQRRIQGTGITYERDGLVHMRVRHVDAYGKNMEGRQAHNLVQRLWCVHAKENETQFSLIIDRATKGLLEITFYDFKGQPKHRATLEITNDDTSQLNFSIHKEMDLKDIGLVEVSSVRVKS
ncbi:MAG: hypothetical protein KDC35_19545 [Acidobacteria bacterium]|nr:hypothetical protein [Acidobacteriota bacterium]